MALATGSFYVMKKRAVGVADQIITVFTASSAMYSGTEPFLNHCADIGGNRTRQARRLREPNFCSRLTLDRREAAMAPLYSKHVPVIPVVHGFAETQVSMREDIESIRRSVSTSRVTIAECQEAIGRADKVLARRIWDGLLVSTDSSADGC